MRTNKQLTKKLVNVIITEKRPYSQDSGRKQADEYTKQNKDTPLISAIFDCVCDRQATDAVEILEKRGVSGDLALFILANLQEIGREV